MKNIYKIAICIAAGILIYFYFINFDNMSETMLVNSVLFWYIPLTFGLYGLTALRIKETIKDPEQNVIKHLFAWEDPAMNALAATVTILSGLIGVFLFFIPLTIFKVKIENYDIKVAVLGSAIWLVLLVLFFIGIWPSL